MITVGLNVNVIGKIILLRLCSTLDQITFGTNHQCGVVFVLGRQ
jgi:hypothetical protein